jgi:hypothetical protein
MQLAAEIVVVIGEKIPWSGKYLQNVQKIALNMLNIFVRTIVMLRA